ARGLLLRPGGGMGDAPPGVLDRPVDRFTGRPLEPVFHVPDLLRDRGDDRHFALSLTKAAKFQFSTAQPFTCICREFAGAQVIAVAPRPVARLRCFCKESAATCPRTIQSSLCSGLRSG